MQETVQKLLYKDFLFIYLGSEEDKAIVLSSNRMNSLEETIDSIHKEPQDQIKGIIFTSPPKLAFCVGADLKAIRDVTDPKEGKKLAEHGQRIFAKIEALSPPTFAAIQGHCVGGGCELSLACNYRLMANDEKSRIGLPETKLGILPGFGGTQRLPKLIGLPKAIEFIVNAKVIPSKAALKLGLIDGYIELEDGKITKDKIIESCKRHINQPKKSKLSFIDKILSSTSIGRSIVSAKAIKMSQQKTKGKYPAIPLSIESTLNAFNLNPNIAYNKEAEFLGQLIVSPESKSLVHLFYLTEFSSKIGKKSGGDKEIESVGIIGAGVMGKGIAAVSLKNNFLVKVSDANSKSLDAIKSHVSEFISESKSLNSINKERVLNNFSTTINNQDLKESDILIEAATENLDIKRKIFASITGSKNQEQIIATNTSSLTLTSIFRDLPNKDRAVGIHFFNPVEKMPLIEIVRSKNTSDQTIIKACSFASRLGKYPVVVEDVPGFLVNRILSPYLAEASLLLKEGANFHALEKTVTDFGFPMGPFRLLDEVGLDIASKVQEVLTSGYGERMTGSGYLDKVMQKGLLGKKNGNGFYLHSVDKPLANIELLKELGINTDASKIKEEEILERILYAMILESLRAYEEEVAGKIGPEAMGQIDLSSVMGFGFPPFRGGILFYAKNLGFKKIQESIKKYEKIGPRFKSPEILTKLI